MSLIQEEGNSRENPLLRESFHVTSEHDEASVLASVVGDSSMEQQTEGSSIKRKSRSIARSFTASVAALVVTDIKEYFCFCVPYKWILLPENGHNEDIKNSNVSTVLLLLNLMIGSGILVQAYVFKEAGILLTVVEYIIIGCMIFTGVNLTIRAAEVKSNFDLTNLAQELLPPYGGFAVDLCITLSNAGALLSYILIVGSQLKTVVRTYSPNSSGWYSGIAALTFIPIVGLSLPLCLVRSFGHLAIVSYLSIAVIGACIFLVLVGGPINKTADNDDNYGILNLFNFYGCIATIGDIVFALGFLPGIFPAYAALETKSVSNFTKISFNTTLGGVLMCGITGFAGYMSFGDNTEVDILDNFPGKVGAFFKLALIFHLLLYIPGDFIILRTSFLNFFNIDVAKQSNFWFVIVTVTMISVVTFIAVVLQVNVGEESLNLVVDITGGVTGSAIYFILPALIARKALSGDTFYMRSANMLLVFGIMIVVLVTASTVLNT